MSTASNPEWQEYYDYLDELRTSGVTNMFGAAPYLMERFDIDRPEAKEILLTWMKEFSRADRQIDAASK